MYSKESGANDCLWKNSSVRSMLRNAAKFDINLSEKSGAGKVEFFCFNECVYHDVYILLNR